MISALCFEEHLCILFQGRILKEGWSFVQIFIMQVLQGTESAIIMLNVRYFFSYGVLC